MRLAARAARDLVTTPGIRRGVALVGAVRRVVALAGASGARSAVRCERDVADVGDLRSGRWVDVDRRYGNLPLHTHNQSH